MKNKKIVFAVMFFLFAALIHGAELTDFSFESGLGFLNGIIIEDVWNVKVRNSGTTTTYTATTRLSRLDWQLQQAPFMSFETSATFDRHFTVNFAFSNAFNGTIGIMEDFDWKITSEPDHLTNYSVHLLNLQSFYFIRTDLGYKFRLNTKRPFSITPLFGLEVYGFDFCGVSGYKLYESEGWEKVFWKKDEIVIQYMQYYFAPRASLALDWDFAKHFGAAIKLGAVYSHLYHAYDFHESKSTFYDDRIHNAWFFDGVLQLYVKINDMNKIGLKGSINYMPQTYAFTHISYDSKTEYSELPLGRSLGGTSRLLWTYALTYTFKF